MATVKLIDPDTADPRIKAVFDDIKATKKIDWVPAIWRALANHPEHLELCWSRLKAIMQPGALDMMTKELLAVAVSITNGCAYCINSHTAAAMKFGMTPEQYGEALGVIGLFNQMNKLAEAFQIEPDVRPPVD
jgi:AhpD family alkylhydroperoxidase